MKNGFIIKTVKTGVVKIAEKAKQIAKKESLYIYIYGGIKLDDGGP